MELRWWNVRVCGLLLFLAVSGLARAQDMQPPSLRCASVSGSDVQLEWVSPPDPNGDIDHYEIYYATALNGPYSMVATVPFAPPIYMHNNAGANTGARYYYMRSVSAGAQPDVSEPSDTLATMFIQVSQSVPLGSSVVNWNLPHNPPVPTNQPVTLVGQGHSVADLQGIDDVPNSIHHWQRVVDECDVSLVFMVSNLDSSGCFAHSNIAGGQFQDITPPTIPVIVEATVDTTNNKAVLNWDPSPEADTEGYIVVLASAGNAILDTVYGRLNTSYTWPLSNAGAAPESYTVAAIDSCWRGNPPSPNTSAASAPHTTVHVHTRYDQCDASIQVQRSDYVGWEVAQYQVFEQVNGNAPFLASILLPGQYQYKAIGMQPGREYCFFVKAVGYGPGQEALSNKSCKLAAYPAVPQWNYIRTVTVDAPDRVLIVDSLDGAAFNKRLLVERSYNGLPFEEVATVPGGFGPVVTVVDSDVLTSERSYIYRITVEDSCGHAVATSNLGSSILLNADPGLDGINHLRWNGYLGWDGAVQQYAVYRSVAGWPFELVGITNEWQFNDNVQEFVRTPGRFCYYVVAEESGNASGINAISTSNIACAVQHEEVWIPNAFIEGGYNNTFKPELAYVDVDRYEFTIYNRWGQQIWTTKDRDEAWDGRVGGTVVPMGVYAYYCSFVNGAGKTVVRSGTVTFLSGQ